MCPHVEVSDHLIEAVSGTVRTRDLACISIEMPTPATVRVVTTTASGETASISAWLEPTEFLDFKQSAVQRFCESTVGDVTDQRQQAVRLFYAVRDGYWYDPYSSDMERDAFRASNIVEDERSWCVPKSILLTAAARAVGIPARLGFADVRNHLQSEKLKATMGTDLFAFHGYSELLLDGSWVKASAAFNLELCRRFDTKPLEFDGTTDALLHPFDEAGNRHMEYVNDRGSYDDFPFEEMTAAFEEIYGPGPVGSGSANDAPTNGDMAFEPPKP